MNRKTVAYILTVLHPGFGDLYMRSYAFGLFWMFLYLAGHFMIIISIGILGIPIFACFLLMWIVAIVLLRIRNLPNERISFRLALRHLLLGAAAAVLIVIGFWAFFLKFLWQAF